MRLEGSDDRSVTLEPDLVYVLRRGGNSLHIPNARRQMRASYAVRANNSLGSATAYFDLNVYCTLRPPLVNLLNP